jgi:hypothetical protein
MSAVIEPGNSAAGAPAPSEAVRVSARAAVLALAAVVIAFGAAYAIGSMAKKTNVVTPSGQLAPASAPRGQSSVQIAVPGAAGAIPALAQAAKAKPARHAQTAAQTQSASVSQTQSTSSVSSSSSAQQQSVAQQQPVTPVAPVTPKPPVVQPKQPVVIVHSG